MVSAARYRVYEDSLQWHFHRSRAKIQIFGGGFANGKTSAACIKALRLAKDYPGSNGLMARSTYPKLNDTLRKEFFKWCPKHWIKSFSKTDNVVTLTNGSTINFRYISQQGKSQESSTSNLLSATYDWIVVDQMEDPEIQAKDFDDLLGRLRGSARYNPDPNDRDPMYPPESMPHNGTRWFIITCNPTRNWVYKKLIKPLHDYQKGIINPDLMVDPNTKKPIMELFEGSTYTNADNLEADFIQTLETAYKGQMRDRFLLGKWAAYEGLVFPTYAPEIHMIPDADIKEYFRQLRKGANRHAISPSIVEGFDYGLAVPSCYTLGLGDHRGNVITVDGFYTDPKSDEGNDITVMARKIKAIRQNWGVREDRAVLADPSVFKRSPSKTTVSITVAGLFAGEGISMIRANNEIASGITRMNSYLHINRMHKHPIYDTYGAPHLYFNAKLDFIDREITEYYWQKDTQGEYTDEPVDRNDHAMNTLKYMLSMNPALATIVQRRGDNTPEFMKWHEMEQMEEQRNHRYH